MRGAVAMSLLAVACASSVPPMRAGGPADPRAPEGPVAAASPELTADSGISRYESGSAPMMGNMQMARTGDGGAQHDMGGMGGMQMDGGTQHDMGGMGGMQMGGMGDGGMQHEMGGMAGMHMGDGGTPHKKRGKRKVQGGMKMDGGMHDMGGMQMDGGMHDMGRMGGMQMDGGMR